MSVALPAVTSILAFLFSLALFDQWRERRHGYQLIWAIGMLFFGIASGCEALGSASGWNEALYRTWYLTGAVWTAGWLGLGTAFLLGRTRFGYTFAVCLFLAGLFTFLTQAKYQYPGSGSAPILYLIAALVLAIAIGVETYFQNERWPYMAAFAVVGATILSVILMATASLAAPGFALDPATHVPIGDLFPGTLRLLTPFLNITGSFALVLGAVFSTYVFMPKKRVLAYSLDPNQPGDHFLFNLFISWVALIVNFVASLPGAVNALVHVARLLPVASAVGGSGRPSNSRPNNVTDPAVTRATPGLSSPVMASPYLGSRSVTVWPRRRRRLSGNAALLDELNQELGAALLVDLWDYDVRRGRTHNGRPPQRDRVCLIAATAASASWYLLR